MLEAKMYTDEDIPTNGPDALALLKQYYHTERLGEIARRSSINRSTLESWKEGGNQLSMRSVDSIRGVLGVPIPGGDRRSVPTGTIDELRRDHQVVAEELSHISEQLAALSKLVHSLAGKDDGV